MPLRENPFHQIYYTEAIKPTEYVTLFSPLLMSDTLALFQDGNVVLEGVQGSGKTMLLALLKPEVRIAYDTAGEDFPVPAEFNRFISGGIHLIRSGAIDFGQRLFTEESERLVRFFADFVNYWIVEDILRTICTLANHEAIAEQLKLRAKDSLDEFAEALSGNECFFGYLEGTTGLRQLQSKIRNRISSYRRFLAGHGCIEDAIVSTTTSAGEPIVSTAQLLRKFDIIPENLPVFIRVDQCETLIRMQAKAEERQMQVHFMSIVNKMLGSRDPSVSYRLGGRKYAFRKFSELQMAGTTETIELFRNYKILDLDTILRRTEHPTNWLFPRFAEDICQRRFRRVGYRVEGKSRLVRLVLGGAQLTTNEKAVLYAGGRPEDAIDLENNWPTEVKNALAKMVRTDVLSAKLGEAWMRQKGAQRIATSDFPWTKDKKRWWRKERGAIASLQIAARRRQKLIWAREKDVTDISGGNVLVFLSLMQQIWATWLASQADDTNWDDDSLPCIQDVYIQSQGIEQASDHWYGKIREDPCGDSRRRFISLLGLTFRHNLLADAKMSYPGHNGISLTLQDLESDSVVYRFLQDASAYGFMVDMKHTPKSKSRGESRKWYLHPVLAPHFQIPAIHTKEPMYVNVKLVRRWMEKAKAIPEVLGDVQGQAE